MSRDDADAIPQVATDRLSIRFRTPAGPLAALTNVTLSIASGENLGIIGESGSGKTTLGRALVGLLKPTTGSILYEGVPIASLSRARYQQVRRNYQIIFQDPHGALNPRRPVIQSLVEPLEISGEGTAATRRSLAMEMLQRVGVAPAAAERLPHELSGGQKQRINIARVLVVRPKFIVCDEVTAALDLSIRGSVLNLFRELGAEFGITYAFITHDISTVSLLSDRIAVVYLGKLVEVGPADGLNKAPLHPYTQALLSAAPVPLPSDLRGNNRRIRLVGDIPSPLEPPSGCPFRTRCPIATERCAREEPAWRELRPDHWVACHYARFEGNPILGPEVVAPTDTSQSCHPVN